MKKILSKILIASTAALGLWITSSAVIAEETLTPNETTAATPEQKDTQPAQDGLGQKLNDAATTARVKSRLILDKNTSGLSINVDTDHNEVTLNGTVDSESERVLAELIARNTKGVHQVQNHLKVARLEDHGDGAQSMN